MPTAHRELLAVAATSPAQRVPCLLESIRSQRGIGSSSLLFTSQLACGSCNRQDKRSHHSLAIRTEDCRELRKKRSSRTVLQLTQTSSWCSVMTSSYMENLESFSWCTVTKEFRKKQSPNTVFQLTQRSSWCFGMTYDMKKMEFLLWLTLTKELRKQILSHTVFLSMNI